MKVIVVFASLILAIHSASDIEQWSEFKLTHGKEYRNLIEEQTRFSVFQDNLRKIESHNEKYEKGETSYYLGTTQFADWTKNEFLSFLNTEKPDLSNYEVKTFDEVNLEDLPATVDWRDKGVVTAVKNQGQCGSCWAFAATGTLESAYAIKTGKLVSLSEQNLVDCSTVNGNKGCSGGTVHAGLDYAHEQGIELESDYPYTAKDESCHFTSTKSVFRSQKYVAVTYDSESELQKAVGTVGPVAVSVNAADYQLYSGGIIDDDSCSQSVDHGVLVIGYGTENGKDYWLVKNSWGSSWGDKGYLKMSRNKNDQCGIALWGVYAVI